MIYTVLSVGLAAGSFIRIYLLWGFWLNHCAIYCTYWILVSGALGIY